MELRVGDAAPPFKGKTTDGKDVSLADYAGKKLVLYFYPKDDTPGCTKEACSLRDHNKDIKAKGAEILGVSADTLESHKKFSEKFKLNFPLLADPDKAVCRAYGAVGGKGEGLKGMVQGLVMGAMGVPQRWTYVIDEKGRIAHVIERPDVAHHAEEVLALL